jgi:hypothetical protein
MANLTAMEALTDEVNDSSEELTPTGRKKRGKNKWKRGELKAIREAKKLRKQNEARIEEISNDLHDLMLRIWGLFNQGKRNSPEHLGLREEMHVLHAERLALGYNRLVFITEEDKQAAKRYKADKKKARMEKRGGGQKMIKRAAVEESEGDE